MEIELKPCSCSGIPEIKETWDTLRICCPKCGKTTPVFFGDYYDEAYMLAIHGEEASEEWNRRAAEKEADQPR